MAMRLVLALIVVCHVIASVWSDCYMHFPRGNNNRLNERTANRKNANRLFDSQNNNKGGYNVGDRTVNAANQEKLQYQMTFFQSGPPGKGDSYLPIEWTNQHGCGPNTPDDPIKLNCQMVMQYMCQPAGRNAPPKVKIRAPIRDGITRGTNQYQAPKGNLAKDTQSRKNIEENGQSLPETFYEARNRLHVNNPHAGMNEPYMWRDKCETRRRNEGLFTADQKLKRVVATATRQNNNANRYGYECPEERDYYPYWHPTDWKDAAILVADGSRCAELKTKSFNTHPYNECVEMFKPHGNEELKEAHYSLANNNVSCDKRPNSEWRTYHNYLEKLTNEDGDAPETEEKCQTLATDAKLSAANVTFGYAIYGKEKECLVNLPKPDCQVGDFSRVNHLGNGGSKFMETNYYQWKIPYFPSGERQKCVFRMRYNISTTDFSSSINSDFNGAKSPVQPNPEVLVGLPNAQKLKLAINTAQFGRTFQDRAHVFYLEPRKQGMEDKDIKVLSIRGKRGNIVQTYPAVEYDFVPNNFTIDLENELLHVQWTGSNTHNNANPAGDGQAGDAGEGRGGTDRNNILSMADSEKNFFKPLEDKSGMWHNVAVVWAAKGITDSTGFTPIDIGLQMASSGHFSCLKCSNADSLHKKKYMDKLLNNATPTFPGMVVKFKNEALHHFGCTRNNNFSNRSQKGCVKVVKKNKK